MREIPREIRISSVGGLRKRENSMGIDIIKLLLYGCRQIEVERCLMNIYETCPILESEKFILRLDKENDCDDLLKVYSDKNALPFFNSDNSDGDNFYYRESLILNYSCTS